SLAKSGLTLSLDGQVDRVGAWLMRLPSEVRFERIDVGLVSLCCSALRARTDQLQQHMSLFRRARQLRPEQMHLGEHCIFQLISGWHAQHQERWADALGHSYHTLRLANEAAQLTGIHTPVLPDLVMRATRLKADALLKLGCHDESITVLKRLILLASELPHRALLARARVAMVHRSQGLFELALHTSTAVIVDAERAGLSATHATGYARYVRSLVYLDLYQPYAMVEEAERAWSECFSAIHAHDRLCVERTLQRMRRATDMLQRPPPVPLFDVSTIVELCDDDLELMNRYAYGLNHWEVSRTMGVHSADIRQRTLQIRRRLGAGSRTEAVQMLRAAGRVTHYPSLTMY
ncbi:MAG: DNA-binding CsgD family transcriptional regulator, partial [Kiritimatiellia bacterium]